MSSKKERLMAIIEKIAEKIPAPYSLMMAAYFPQFQRLSNQITDDHIDGLIAQIESALDYVKTGDGECPL